MKIFLYWEDIDLMERVKNSNFRMVKVLNSTQNTMVVSQLLKIIKLNLLGR